MNGYKAKLWTPVFHNGEFSHHITEEVVVHTLSYEAAKAAISADLKRGCGYNTSSPNAMLVELGDQYIYTLEYLGEVFYETTVVYKDKDEK